jgi:flavorubredoxin
MGEVEKAMKDMGWQVPVPGMNLNYVPDPAELDKVRECGRNLGITLRTK